MEAFSTTPTIEIYIYINDPAVGWYISNFKQIFLKWV